MDIKVSVVIPVYNVEKYIVRCLNSVINQSIKDIEIIVINDGSTDDSAQIIQSYILNDKRIKYFSHSNIGLGMTRNFGITIAKGEYIAFVDSDDYLDLDALRIMYDNAKYFNSDVVCAQTILVNDANSEVRSRNVFKNLETIYLSDVNKSDFIKEYYFGRVYTHNAWDKIYKLDFIRNYQISFGDNKRIFAEDNYFQLQILEFVKVISFVPFSSYFYVNRQNSIMNSYKADILERQLNFIMDYEEFYIKHGSSELNLKINSLQCFDILIIEVINILNSKLSFKKYSNSIKYLMSNQYFIDQIKNILKYKSYKLLPEFKKCFFVFLISILIILRFTNITAFIIFNLYRKNTII